MIVEEKSMDIIWEQNSYKAECWLKSKLLVYGWNLFTSPFVRISCFFLNLSIAQIVYVSPCNRTSMHSERNKNCRYCRFLTLRNLRALGLDAIILTLF